MCIFRRRMIKNSEVDEFISNLSNHLQTLVERISVREDWSTDDLSDVQELIDELSDKLDSTSSDIINRASHYVLSSSAYFSLPRFLKLFVSLSQKSPEIITTILDGANSGLLPDGPLFLKTAVHRLRYIVQSILIRELFDPATIDSIYIAVMKHDAAVETTSIEQVDDAVVDNDPDPLYTDSKPQNTTQLAGNNEQHTTGIAEKISAIDTPKKLSPDVISDILKEFQDESNQT